MIVPHEERTDVVGCGHPGSLKELHESLQMKSNPGAAGPPDVGPTQTPPLQSMSLLQRLQNENDGTVDVESAWMQTSQLLVMHPVPTGTRHVFVYWPQLRDLQL